MSDKRTTFRVNPQENAYIHGFLREESLSTAFSLEVPFEDEAISTELEAQAKLILQHAVDSYASSRTNHDVIKSSRYPLNAGRCLIALVENALGAGRQEVLKAILRAICDVPHNSEPGALELPRLDTMLKAIENSTIEEEARNDKIHGFADHVINALLVPGTLCLLS
jgi:hypothetical protein